MSENNQNGKFPNFLGIGAMRSGTSWLYVLLKSHPEIFMPNHVKEIHFFNTYYDRGLDWYQSFFKVNNGSQTIKAAGEITPKYMYDEAVPLRVQKHFPDLKFIILLRNPLERAYSHFKMAYFEGVTNANSFSEFINNEPTVVNRGYYAKQINRWFNFFPKNQFLILIFEEVMGNPSQASLSIADFLGISRTGYDEKMFTKKINKSNAPKLSKLYPIGISLRNYLRRNNLNWAAHFVVTGGSRIRKMFGDSKKGCPPMTASDKKQLITAYYDDIENLKKILRRDLSIWNSQIV